MGKRLCGSLDVAGNVCEKVESDCPNVTCGSDVEQVTVGSHLAITTTGFCVKSYVV